MFKLYVNNTEVDLFPDTIVKYNLSLYEIRDFTKRKVFKTGKFDIPLTKNNKSIFSYPDDVNTEPGAQLTGFIEQDGLTFMGNIEVYGVESKAGMKSLGIQLVQSDWLKNIEGLKLSDLTLGSHTVTAATVIPTSISTSRKYIYPIADFGKFKGEDSETTEILAIDCLPAVRVKSIVDAILNEQGWKVHPYSFFESNKNYFLFAGEKAYINDKDFVEERLINVVANTHAPHANLPAPNTGVTTVAAVIEFENTTAEGYFVNGTNYNTSTHRYTVDKAGAYRFFASIEYSYTGGSPDAVTVAIYKNGSTLVSKSKTHDAISGSGTIALETTFLHLSVDDYFEVKISTSTVTTTLNVVSGSYFKNDVDQRRALNYVYNDLSEILPEMEQKIFLQTLKVMFNLYFYSNPYTREILITQRDDFHSDTVQEWSGKLDTASKITIDPPECPAVIRYGYGDDDSDMINKREGGNYTDVSLNTDSLEIDDVRLSEVANTTFNQCLRQNIDTNRIPRIWKDYESNQGWLYAPAPDFGWMPKILHFEGYKSGDSYRFEQNNYSGLATFTNVTAATIAGYYTKFNKNLLKSKLITARFRLKAAEINHMVVMESGKDLRTPVFIFGQGFDGFYYIIEVKNFDGHFADVTLQKVNDRNYELKITDRYPYTLPAQFGGGDTAEDEVVGNLDLSLPIDL